MQKVGLSQEYKSSESEIGIWLKSIFGIAFLGPDEVEDAFVKYFMSIAHNDKRCTGFVYYLAGRYVIMEYKNSPDLQDFH